MPIRVLAEYLPAAIAAQLIADDKQICEIRLRAGCSPQLVYNSEDRFLKGIISAQQLSRIAVAMMEHSYYAHENELSKGFFTMKNGCRVGVCGSFSEKSPGIYVLQSIGSLCVRIARAVPGCASDVVSDIIGNHLCSALILSRPGLGKTTLLRDAARQLSDEGYNVGIADERHEIAACRDGVPSMDVGLRTDVVDGCPKPQAMEHLIRSMSPHFIVTDEIGTAADLQAIREAARRGVSILASAHASSLHEFESSAVGTLVREGIFRSAFLISGSPGSVVQIRHYGRGGEPCS